MLWRRRKSFSLLGIRVLLSCATCSLITRLSEIIIMMMILKEEEECTDLPEV
jgi:hypothetical protein